MWKHVPAKTSIDLKSGDRIQVRWGSSPSYEFRISGHSGMLTLSLYDQEGDKRREIRRKTENTVQLRHDFGYYVAGGAFDIWVEEKKMDDEVKVVIENGVTPRKCLVHKSHVVLQKGQRFTTEPYRSSVDSNCYELIVCDAISGRPGYWNVLVKTPTRQNFHTHISSLADLRLLDKQCCYLIIGEYASVCPNGVVAIPERDDDEARDVNGQYIIWCPTSDLPPRQINRGAAQAKAIAAAMSERHGKTFYWCRLMGKVEQKVVKTTTTEITTL